MGVWGRAVEVGSDRLCYGGEGGLVVDCGVGY